MFILLLCVSSVTGDVIAMPQYEYPDQSNAMVPAMFVFGDSVLDTGTNTLFPSLLQADFKPYGTQYFGKPTGRFTNGRTYADFFATYIGLPLVEPYLKRKGKWSVIQGVNFASAGSGLLRSSNAENKVIPFPDQVQQFGQTKLQIEQTLKSVSAAKDLFSKSLFLINIGANDIVTFLFSQTGPAEQFIDGLLVILEDSIKVLYEAGARKVVLMATGPVGCIPGILAPLKVTDGKCIEAFNDVGKMFNAALETFVNKMPTTFPYMKAVICKPYERFHEFIVNGKPYGFTAGVTACCGAGAYNGDVQCGRPSDLIKNPPTNVCDNVDEHVFWDYYHPTDKAYSMLAKEFWSGDSSFVSPVNIKTLVSY